MHYKRVILTGAILLISANCWGQSFHTGTAKSPDAGTMFVYPERIPLKEGGMTTVNRGLMFVPLNRTKADSDVIAVEFYRFPRSESADPTTPPIFVLKGGPGFGGLEGSLKRPGTFEREFQDQTNISDVIVVGQRGIGSSKPDTVIDQSTKPQSVDKPHDAKQAEAEFRKVLSRERQFWIDQGVDLTGFNTLEAAADVRDVARGLGYDKIIITGGSFGSHWGMAIMRTYPELVARAVLTGMEGPDHTWDHPGWYWNVYKRVAKDAESSEKLKDLIPDGGLIQAAESLAQNARENPLTINLNEGTSEEKKVVIDGFAMGRLVRGTSGLKNWPADIIRLHRGDFEQAARRVLMRAAVSRREFSTASYWMLDSGSGITDRRRAEFESDPAMNIVGSTFWHYSAGSPVWGIDLGDEFRSDFETDIPTVIVHGTWDTSTPYENAVELAPYFKNSKFVTVKRGSHGALGEAIQTFPDFRNALVKFVRTGDQTDLPAELELPEPDWRVPEIEADDE